MPPIKKKESSLKEYLPYGAFVLTLIGVFIAVNTFGEYRYGKGLEENKGEIEITNLKKTISENEDKIKKSKHWSKFLQLFLDYLLEKQKHPNGIESSAQAKNFADFLKEDGIGDQKGSDKCTDVSFETDTIRKYTIPAEIKKIVHPDYCKDTK
jgi:hypothetical protein